MNDKLAKFARKNIRPKSAGMSSFALVSVTKQAVDNGNYYYMRVSLHRRVTQKLGWRKGDRIRIDITSTGNISLSRDNQHSRMLRKASGRRTQVRFRVTPEFYYAVPTGEGVGVEIDSGRITFGLESND